MSLPNASQARSLRFLHMESDPNPPEIDDDEPVADVLDKLARYLIQIITVPQTFEDLSTISHGHVLSPLVEALAKNVHHPAIVAALLALRPHFAAQEDYGDGLQITRAYACEVVAWRLTTHLSEREAIEYLLYELPEASTSDNSNLDADPESGRVPHGIKYDGGDEPSDFNEATSLLTPHKKRVVSHSPSRPWVRGLDDALPANFSTFVHNFEGLNALEIAAVCEAKKFLCQRPVQRIVNGIWRGDIVFWESMSVHTVKKAQFHDPKRCDLYCRLRVPLYAKCYEVLFFAAFLALYYAVLVQRDPSRITSFEVLLLVWFAAFAYDEFGQYLDAGLTFYVADFWSLWDFGIIALGLSYFIIRIIGLCKRNAATTATAFDILSLEALFLVPRICSLLSLHPFFGTLIPCLKDITKYSIQFFGLVAILYCGFLTTFILLGRDAYTPAKMSWILIKVFFGSSYLGFDAAEQISPVLGPPLMLVFVWLTNILLITTLISVLSNRVSAVMAHAREEYLFLYSVFVLEASTSSRLTYYLPPLNLLSLLLRPLRLAGLSAEHLRGLRIAVLKMTHAPHVVLIHAYERGRRLASTRKSLRAAVAARDFSNPPGTPLLGPPLAKIRSHRSNRVASARGAAVSGSGAQYFGSPRAKSPGASMMRRRGEAASVRSTLDLGRAPQMWSLSAQIDELRAKVDELITATTKGRQSVVATDTDAEE